MRVGNPGSSHAASAAGAIWLRGLPDAATEAERRRPRVRAGASLPVRAPMVAEARRLIASGELERAEAFEAAAEALLESALAAAAGS